MSSFRGRSAGVGQLDEDRTSVPRIWIPADDAADVELSNGVGAITAIESSRAAEVGLADLPEIGERGQDAPFSARSRHG
jgi:hypothetical protein